MQIHTYKITHPKAGEIVTDDSKERDTLQFDTWQLAVVHCIERLRELGGNKDRLGKFDSESCHLRKKYQNILAHVRKGVRA
jgi:hypothetical protein